MPLLATTPQKQQSLDDGGCVAPALQQQSDSGCSLFDNIQPHFRIAYYMSIDHHE